MFASDELRPATNGRKPLGKLASRLEEVKNPWRQVSTLELSHNEAARLATDALLEHGESEYRRVLLQEREVSFLSPPEIRYISQHAASRSSGSDGGAHERDIEDGDAVSELTSGTYFPMMSDEQPPPLELGWPAPPARYGPSETNVYFQRDKSHNLKDIIRSLINRAKKVIAVVMDEFTDVDLMCDLMEASNKRRVPVYILLDERSLCSFTDMCSALDIQNSHLSNMRIRSVCGDTYCTKSGKKFTGQVLEKFLIIDCEEVIAGSYSFTWLSAQVHTNMVMHFSGHLTEIFDREFRCLYADSQIIDGFHNPDEDGLPYYASYHSMVTGLGMGAGRGLGLDLLLDRTRDRPCSENSSSQSSNSVSSVKMAPGMTSNAIYKSPHDKKEPYLSPQRRDGGQATPARGPANAAAGHAPVLERSPAYVQTKTTDWSKPSSADAMRSKIQGLTLYDSKPSLFHNSSNPNVTPKAPTPTAGNDGKLTSKHRSSSSPFINKLSDLFLPPSSKDKESYNFNRTPPPQGPSPWAGPDLSQPEPENHQSPPPPAPFMNRHDQKRMTLGHSKLELVNQYNKKPKPVYSRFELKSMN